MWTTQMFKRPSPLLFAFFCLCLFLLFDTPAVLQTPTTPEKVQLSPEALQLLEEVKAGIRAYKASLKSGVIAFTLTLSAPKRIPPNTRETSYETKGQWEITYQFDEEHQFYDVKARYKMALNGQPFPNWKETHHHYLSTGNTVQVWQKIGDEWKEQPTLPPDRFELRFNPKWWIYNPYTHFRQFIPITVEKRNEKDTQLYALTLQRRTTDPQTVTVELFLDPRKRFLPTRIAKYSTWGQNVLIKTPFSQKESQTVMKGFTRETYQLARFEPDIWFPAKTTIEQFPDYENGTEPPQWIGKTYTLQVHRAVFNTDKAEENTHIKRKE